VSPERTETVEAAAAVAEAETGGRGSRVLRLSGWVLGLAMLVAAVVAIVRERAVFEGAVEQARSASVAVLALLVLMPMVNWLLTAGVFAVLMRRQCAMSGSAGRVGFSEMLALVGSAWLLNLLPLKPGLVGRIAYHKVINRIDLRDSIAAQVWSVVCTLAAVVIFVLVQAGVAIAAEPDQLGSVRGWLGFITASVAPVAGLVVLASVLAARGGERGAGLAMLVLAASLRLADVLVWGARLALVFLVMGSPQPPTVLAAVVAAMMLANLLPIPIGATEWMAGGAVAVLAMSGALGAPMGGALGGAVGGAEGVAMLTTQQALALGLAAGVLNRAAELIAAVPVGLACTGLIARRLAAQKVLGGARGVAGGVAGGVGVRS
jgi:hypothetical protein